MRNLNFAITKMLFSLSLVSSPGRFLGGREESRCTVGQESDVPADSSMGPGLCVSWSWSLAPSTALHTVGVQVCLLNDHMNE